MRLLFWLSVLTAGCAQTEAPAAPGEKTMPVKPAQETTESTPESAAGEPAMPGIERPDSALVAKLAAAYAARGAGYVPRTHHKHPDGKAKFVNRLMLETSPYLLQHAHNPVNWRPWGDAAFAAAKAQGRPVLLSVGYSTCHWCHVMERESFEDLEISTFINTHFIAIKVDREERPDVDGIYMEAVRHLSGRGGWPMTVMLTPDREAFFGGTYFPPRTGVRGARKGFIDILKEISGRYETDRDKLVAEAQTITQKLQAAARPQPPVGLPGAEALERAAQSIVQRFDPTWGGFGRRPKFPRPVTPRFLLRYHRRTGDAQALRAATHTLRKMADGGMHDQIGGGFHRYSTDGRWLVPHFEKMLYDNAQLADLYVEAWQASGDARFAEVARYTLDYVIREMTTPEGGFYSATDADSPAPNGHDEEGLYFTWTPTELKALLGAEDAALVAARFQITDRGNFEGRSIPWTPKPWADAVSKTGLTLEALKLRLEAARLKMYAQRATRKPPIRDDKVIVAWNGLMISAFAKASLALPDSAAYLQAAQKAADFLLARVRRADGRLHRTFMDGKARHNAYLIDYACLITGLLDLFEASTELKYLEAAITLQGVLDSHYADAKNGGYFTTSDDHEALLSRDKPSYDGAMPAGNSIVAEALLRLSEFTGEARFETAGDGVLRAFGRRIQAAGVAVPRLLAALDMRLDTRAEIVFISPAGGNDAELVAALGAAFVPNRVLIRATEGADLTAKTQRIKLLEGKIAQGGRTTAYVCERGRCERPTSDPKVLIAQLEGLKKPLYENRSAAPLQISAPAATPKPWHYDAKTNKHWHAGHGHWHEGKPPAGRGD